MEREVTETQGGMATVRPLRGERLPDLTRWAANYALVIIFLIFGASKFTPMAGDAIAPLIMNSPLVSWLHGVFGIDGAARVLGVYEILTGLLIAARPANPRASMIGGAMATVTFLITFSFLFSTPGVAGGNPFPLTMLGQFLLKDLVLLAVAVWIFADSRGETRLQLSKNAAT